MNALSISSTASITMSSHEIAELTGKLHAHILRDIRSIFDDLDIDQSNFG